MWNGIRFQDYLQIANFQGLDPVAWSLSVRPDMQCFRHFKGFFVNLAALKAAKLTLTNFWPFWSSLVKKVKMVGQFGQKRQNWRILAKIGSGTRGKADPGHFN